MTAWVPFTDATFQNALPVEFLTQHAAWVGMHPAKAARLTEIVAAVRNAFRSAVRCNPANVVDPDETTVPATGEEYAFVMAAYKLGLEFGLTSAAVVPGSSVVSLVVNVPSGEGLSEGGGGGAVTPILQAGGSGSGGLNFLDQLGQRLVRAEIWLRMVQSGLIKIEGGGDGGGTPSYRGPEERGAVECGRGWE